MPKNPELVGLSKGLRSLIGGRKAAEHLQHYADIAQKIHLGLLIWRLENSSEVRSLRLIGSNSAAEQALGFRVSAFLGKTIAEIFPGALETEEPEILRKAALNDGMGDLHCMRERLRELGGRLEISSNGRGTTVSPIMPVSSEAV
jgi:PAS domain-containing protein